MFVREVGRAAAQEAWRIEAKYSRYRPESIVSVINPARDTRLRWMAKRPR